MKDRLEKLIQQEQVFTERLKRMNTKLEEILQEKFESNRLLEKQISDLEREINDLKFDSLRKEKPVPCMWDSIPQTDRMKPMGISCPCPRCTPSSMVFWRNATVALVGINWNIPKG